MPDSAECEELAAGFEKICNIPQLILALDGSHIPVTPSMSGHADFFNRKGWPSLILQAAVDYKAL